MVEPLGIIDIEARRLLVMEWAAGLELVPCALQLDRPPDQGGQRDRVAQLIEPLGGKHDFFRRIAGASRLRTMRTAVL